MLERLNSCHMKVQTSATYSDLAKLLFCISKFSELGKDTRDQQTLADLCAEAKSLVSPLIGQMYCTVNYCMEICMIYKKKKREKIAWYIHACVCHVINHFYITIIILTDNIYIGVLLNSVI